MSKHNSSKYLFIVFIIVIFTSIFISCDKPQEYTSITSINQLNEKGRRIGVPADTAEYKTVNEKFPLAQVEYFKDDLTGFLSVSQGKIDAYIYETVQIENAIDNGLKGVKLLNETIREGNKAGVAISPKSSIKDLEGTINSFLDEIKSNGTLADIENRWLYEHNEKMPDIKKPDKPEYHIVVGTTGTNPPFNYYVGTKLSGYDIELAYRFASWLNADIEFKVYNYDGIVEAALNGDIDCIFANLFMTSEREEAIHFSQPTYIGKIGALVRDTSVSIPEYQFVSELNNKTIAALTGSNIPEHIHAALPDAEILFFNTIADEINALKNHKADAVALDEPVARNIISQDNSLSMMNELLEDLEYAFILGKSDKSIILRDEFNNYLQKMYDDGIIESLQKKWFDSKDISTVDMIDYRDFPSTNGIIKLGVFQNPPFAFSRGNIVCGYEIELFSMFCHDHGYGLEITDFSLDAILSSVQSGKVDIACCGITITEERKESMLFSIPDYTGGTALLVRKNNIAGDFTNIFALIAESFEKTFIRENRWQLILEGIGTTLLITVLSIIFGTILGFIVFMACRNGNKLANCITRFFVWLIQGMPVVVLLMILYYIIFSKTSFSGTVISIIGFTFVFASSVFSMIKSGVESIDKGQLEAAYTLGYTNRKAFLKIILPQALPRFMPAYKSEITSLIKATAVVGYVAVGDLTKMGDIIRARTYEAFFPLIAVAAIYYILSAILIFIVNRIEIQADPKRRSPDTILKGVLKND